MRFISLFTILVRKEYLPNINNLAKRHGAAPPVARGPMQPHRLYRLKAGPARKVRYISRQPAMETNHQGNGTSYEI